MKAIEALEKRAPKQAAFVRQYVLDYNATQAYIRAGYKASEEAARRNASRLLTNADVAAAVAELSTALAVKTETDAEWVRRRLREEAEDFSEFSSQSARVRAVELVAKLNGMFELDNKQKTDPLAAFAAALVGGVVKPEVRAAWFEGPDAVIGASPADDEDDLG